MLANQRSYREVANLLDAVKQFMTHFDKYVHIPVIQNVQQRVAAIRADLTQQISGIFRQLAQVRAVDGGCFVPPYSFGKLCETARPRYCSLRQVHHFPS
jgi:hypothetical protein